MIKTEIVNRDFRVHKHLVGSFSVEPHNKKANILSFRKEEMVLLISHYGTNFTLIEFGIIVGGENPIYRFTFKDNLLAVELLNDNKFDSVYAVQIYDSELLKEKILLVMLEKGLSS